MYSTEYKSLSLYFETRVVCFFYSQAWLELVDLDQELNARGIRPAFGPMSRVRNKRLLLKAVEEEDRLTEETFQVPR